MTEEGFPPINDSNFADDGNISEDLCSELDRTVNPFEGPHSQSEFKLSTNNQREEEHPAFRVFVQSPFSHSTSSKLCLDSKFMNISKVKASTELLNMHTQYSPSMSPFSRKQEKSSPFKENMKNAGNPQVESKTERKIENNLKGGFDDDNSRKFRPKVSNPKQFQGFVSDKKPFSEYTNTTENNCFQDAEFDQEYYTGKFGGKEEIIQRQIERFEHSKKVFEQKILKQQRLNKDRELDGCTFHPKIYKSSQIAEELGIGDSYYENSNKKRTLGEFLKSQDEHQKKVAQKIERIRENQQISQEEVRPPQINKKSSKLIDKKREKQRKILQEHSKSTYIDQDIFSRLYRSKSTSKYRIRGLDMTASSACQLSYSTSQSSHRFQNHRRQVSSNSFTVQGRSKTRSDSLKFDIISSNLPSIHEDSSHSKHYMQLYSDALNRKEKLEKMKSGVSMSSKPMISESSKLLIKTRLKKDLQEATERLLIDRPSIRMNNGDFAFNFQQLKKIMSDLGFVKQKKPEVEDDKIELIWNTLSKEEEEPFYYSEQEQQKKVHFRDLLTLLEGITGVYEVVELERVESEQHIQQGQEKKATQQERIGRFNKSVYCLTERDVKQIKQQFQVLAMNRRDYLFECRGSKSTIEYSFKPALSEQSRKIVGKDEKRDTNCFSRLQKGSCKCRRQKQTQDILENAIKEECTFKPKISKHKKNAASLQEEEIWSTLYSQAKITREEKEYRMRMRYKEKEKEELAECSFQPSIHKKVKSIDNSCTSRSFVSSYEDKIYEDFIQRMTKAREHNEAVKIAKQKGCTLDRVLRDSKPFEYPRKKKDMTMYSPLLQFKKEDSGSTDQQDTSNSPGSDLLNSEGSKEEEYIPQDDKLVEASGEIMYDQAMLAPVTERSEGEVNGNSPQI